ncbi:hypothetical protein KDL01_41095 [Actinospica durhamensis]|uniref:Uncharacterized protein n=1 Tax=Actinospica durhamensis TaxID=1508375 RepID=A0A941F1R6_9ACTN|nr:hypothetical protein [Actinospica durhamensis]MBR7839719.1 hypothetical protein [Actinospica durhamensis]
MPTNENDTADLELTAWKNTTSGSLLERMDQARVNQFRDCLNEVLAEHRDDPDSPEVVAAAEFLGAQVRNQLHRLLANDHPELVEQLRYLSFDEALHAVYNATRRPTR